MLSRLHVRWRWVCPALLCPALITLGALMATPASASTIQQTTVNPVPDGTWRTNGPVLTIVAAGSRVYIAGQFTAVSDGSGNSYPIKYVAAYLPDTGTFDTSWNPSPDGEVDALAVSGSTLYLGGKFKHVAGASRTRLAAVDALSGSVDATWKPMANAPVRALAVGGGMVYAGGSFTQLTSSDSGSHAVSVPYLGRINAATGNYDPTWNPQPNDMVRAIKLSLDGSSVYVGGRFTSISGASSTKSIASLDTVTGAPTPGFESGATNGSDRPQAFNLYLDGTNLLAAVGGAGGGCASLNAATGASQWNVHANGNVQAVTALDGAVYCGGHFGPNSGGEAPFGGQVRYKLAAADESTGQVLDFAPVVNSSLGVWTLDQEDNRLFAGGNFTKISGQYQPYFAQFE